MQTSTDELIRYLFEGGAYALDKNHNQLSKLEQKRVHLDRKLYCTISYNGVLQKSTHVRIPYLGEGGADGLCQDQPAVEYNLMPTFALY